MDDAGFEGDVVIDNISDAIEALEAYVLRLPTSPLILDGNLDVWRQNLAAVATHTTIYNTLTSYGPDMLFAVPAGASITSQRSTSVPDARSRFSWQLNGAASVTTVDAGQRIGEAIVNTKGRQSLVFSANVWTGGGAAFTPNLRIGTPAAADDFTTVTNRLDQALQSCADAAWTRVSHVFDPSAYTNIANGLQCELRIPSGSLTAGKTVRIAQFDLRPGLALSAYSPPDPLISALLAKTQYQKSVADATAVGTAGTTVSAKWMVFLSSIPYGERYASVTFPTPFRTTPTILVYPCTTPGTVGVISNNSGADYLAGSGTPIDAKDSGFSLQNVQTGSAAMAVTSNFVQGNWTARARY